MCGLVFFRGPKEAPPEGFLPKDGVGSGFFFSLLWTGFFRYYEELVANAENGHEYALTFIDHVRQEAWFVEINSIDSEQNDAQKFQWPYSWTFTGYAPYDFNFSKKKPAGLWGN